VKDYRSPKAGGSASLRSIFDLASDAKTEGYTKAHQKAGDLCCDPLLDGQDILACEGG